MNNELKGICLCLGLIGIGYVALLILFAIFTGVKIFKSIIFIAVLSSGLISLGLTSQVKHRLLAYANYLWSK